MRSECLLSKYVYDRQLPVSRLVSAVGDKMQIPTQRYGRRPYGVGLLVAGYDDMGPHIYQTCPSANYFDCKAMAIGARSQSARTYLERHLDEFPDCEPEELIKHGLRALRETLPSEQELTTKNCSVGVVGKGQDLVIYSDEAVAPHLAGIDQTKRRRGGQADDVAMEDESETIATMIPKITVVSNTKGWDIVMNEQLIKALARDERVEVSGFVPGHTKKQRDQAQRMNILLYDAKPYSGFDTNELLSYPPDDLKIDILIMHSYGRDVGKQAQDIRNRKGCKWVLVVHTFRKDLEKYLEMVPARSAEFHESEHQLQVDLCEKADLVLAVGHKVAKAYEAEMRTPLRTFIPSIPREFLDTQQRVRSYPFKVLLSASKKYFEVKGCDIAAKAFNRLEDPSIHLLLVVKEGDITSEIKEAMVEKGISRNQLEVRRLFEGDQEKAWRDLLGEVDLLIKPSKSEGFGMAGLRAIAANLPVLISGYCGLAIALRMLPSGNKHVVHSQDPTVWARRIQEIKEKDGQICRSEVEQLKNEYSAAYNLEDQVNSLIDEFSKMVKSDIQHGVKETL